MLYDEASDIAWVVISGMRGCRLFVWSLLDGSGKFWKELPLPRSATAPSGAWQACVVAAAPSAPPGLLFGMPGGRILYWPNVRRDGCASVDVPLQDADDAVMCIVAGGVGLPGGCHVAIEHSLLHWGLHVAHVVLTSAPTLCARPECLPRVIVPCAYLPTCLPACLPPCLFASLPPCLLASLPPPCLPASLPAPLTCYF